MTEVILMAMLIILIVMMGGVIAVFNVLKACFDMLIGIEYYCELYHKNKIRDDAERMRAGE